MTLVSPYDDILILFAYFILVSVRLTKAISVFVSVSINSKM